MYGCGRRLTRARAGVHVRFRAYHACEDMLVRVHVRAWVCTYVCGVWSCTWHIRVVCSSARIIVSEGVEIMRTIERFGSIAAGGWVEGKCQKETS